MAGTYLSLDDKGQSPLINSFTNRQDAEHGHVSQIKPLTVVTVAIGTLYFSIASNKKCTTSVHFLASKTSMH